MCEGSACGSQRAEPQGDVCCVWGQQVCGGGTRLLKVGACSFSAEHFVRSLSFAQPDGDEASLLGSCEGYVA